MKYVRTAQGYRALNLEGDDNVGVVITGTPQELANDKAAAAEKAGESAGVEVLVFDSLEDAQEGLSTSTRLGVATPDLAAGRAAVFGTGDPVQTLGATPEGDTPAQADGQAPPAVSSPAPTPPTATPRGVNPEGI